MKAKAQLRLHQPPAADASPLDLALQRLAESADGVVAEWGQQLLAGGAAGGGGSPSDKT